MGFSRSRWRFAQWLCYRWFWARILVALALTRWRLSRSKIDLRQFSCPSISSFDRELRDSDWLRIGLACHAVESVGRWVLPETHPCLPTAVVAFQVLRGWDYPADLRLGIASSVEGGIEAHAWVECCGRVVVGRIQREMVALRALRSGTSKEVGSGSRY